MAPQDRNQSRSARPKAGDGTQQIMPKTDDANWFGASQQPQEEFTENRPVSPHPGEKDDERARTSEGRPTFSGSMDARGRTIGAPKPTQ